MQYVIPPGLPDLRVGIEFDPVFAIDDQAGTVCLLIGGPLRVLG